MKLITCRFEEKNLEWIKKLEIPYIVYNKGKDDIPNFVENVINIPNICRENYAYLTYIIDNYDNLDDYIVFTQARPFDGCKNFLEEIGKYDFKPLSDHEKEEDGKGNPYHTGLPIKEVCNEILYHNSDKFIYHTACQFVTSKERILFREKDRWIALKNKLEKNPEYIPWTLERLWNLILDGKTLGRKFW